MSTTLNMKTANPALPGSALVMRDGSTVAVNADSSADIPYIHVSDMLGAGWYPNTGTTLVISTAAPLANSGSGGAGSTGQASDAGHFHPAILSALSGVLKASIGEVTASNDASQIDLFSEGSRGLGKIPAERVAQGAGLYGFLGGLVTSTLGMTLEIGCKFGGSGEAVMNLTLPAGFNGQVIFEIWATWESVGASGNLTFRSLGRAVNGTAFSGTETLAAIAAAEATSSFDTTADISLGAFVQMAAADAGNSIDFSNAYIEAIPLAS